MIKETEITVQEFTYAVFNSEIQMKLIHNPTGISVTGNGRGRHKLKKDLLLQLESKVEHEPTNNAMNGEQNRRPELS